MRNYYKKSKKIFQKKIREDKKMSKVEWDTYASENCLFSANTLMFHIDARNFEELKSKLS